MVSLSLMVYVCLGTKTHSIIVDPHAAFETTVGFDAGTLYIGK